MAFDAANVGLEAGEVEAAEELRDVAGRVAGGDEAVDDAEEVLLAVDGLEARRGLHGTILPLQSTCRKKVLKDSQHPNPDLHSPAAPEPGWRVTPYPAAIGGFLATIWVPDSNSLI